VTNVPILIESEAKDLGKKSYFRFYTKPACISEAPFLD